MNKESLTVVQLESGKIINEALEINVVHHCNLRCKSCSHASPHFKKHYSDPSSIYKDLRIMSSCYKPDHIRLVGGEPLLHPSFLEVLLSIKRSGICNKIRLLTNGILLSRADENIWAELSEIHVSVYPGFELSESASDKIAGLAHEHNVTVKLMYFGKFRESYSYIAQSDKTLTSRIYNTCQIAHSWRCHTISDGYFYKCPQSLFLPAIINQIAGEFRVEISERPDLRDNLISFIQSKNPLKSCNFCLGSVGSLFEHRQQPRILPNNEGFPGNIDMKFLLALEENPDIDNGCCTSEVDLYSRV